MKSSTSIRASAIILGLLGVLAFAPAARAVLTDPMITMEFNEFSFNPSKNDNKPGMLNLTPGVVTSATYQDGTTTTVNTDFETIIGAKVRIDKLIQSDSDPATFFDTKLTITKGKDLYISGILTNITFDPGSNLADGIVTLNLGFKLDNLFFDVLNMDANSRFTTEYGNFSSMNAGALALTLNSITHPKGGLDLFDVKTKGSATGEFQIPEPGTFILLATGLLGMGAHRRRR